MEGASNRGGRGLRGCDPHSVSSAEWQADGVKDAGSPGARIALTEREGQRSSERDRRATLLNTRPCYVSWTGPPDGKAGQAGGGGDPLPGVLRQRVPAMGRHEDITALVFERAEQG